MPGEVKTSRRKYHSPLRADQARQTRRRVLEAAYRLFVDRGYAGTTIAAVAMEAGVSQETIYLSLGGKRGLLEGVIEMAIAGEDDPATPEGAWWADIERLTSPAERLERMVEYSCGILARTRPIHSVIRGAADKETFAGDLGKRLLHDRLTAQTERVRRYLGADLRGGTVGRRGRPAVLRAREPRALQRADSRVRLDNRRAQGLAHRPAEERAPRSTKIGAWTRSKPQART